ncbi:MAG: zf-HC2 domain-containing protein [Burkholderiaceae bacterium]
MFFRRTCKQVAHLLIAKQDRRLGFADRLALRTHLFVCRACPRFERQILTMQNALKRWRNYSGD